jgi:tetratricopeptide (TPR) repeat protein
MKLRPLRRVGLRQFRRVLETELNRFLPNYECRLDAPDSHADLSSPLIYQNKDLGCIYVQLKEGFEPAPKEVLALFPQIVEAALTKVSLHKALITDSETGLNNRNFFYSKMEKLLRPTGSGPKALKLWEGDNTPELVLALFEVGINRRSPKAELKNLSSIIKEIPELISLARLGDRRLGAIFRAQASEALARLENVRSFFLKNNPNVPYYSAYALHPQDLALDPHGPFNNPSKAVEALMDKAVTALHFAFGRRTPSPVIGFGELVNSFGQIVQLLPQDRALINLGRSMGALPGQVFTIQGQSGERKGEISIFETAEAHSLARISGGHTHFSVGDQLIFSRMDWSTDPPSPTELKAQACLECENFLKNLSRLAQSELPVALALIRLDDHEQLAAMIGDSELERRLLIVTNQVKNASPSPELVATWTPASIAVAWGNITSEAAKGLAEGLIESLRTQAPVSIGLILWPNPVLKPEGLMSSAQKTLLEAAMTGSQSLAIFGPQTLNISGDHLFDEGDLQGALDEYKKGLLLDPGHLNLLNSLGVCHGRLGDHKAAIAAFDEVLHLDNNNLMAHFNKACSLLLLGHLELAEESLKQAETIEPKNFEVLFHLGKTALELGHLSLALTALSRATEQKGRRGGIHRLLGQAHLLSGDPKRALAAFKQAVKFDPDDAESLSSLGALFLESANDQEVALSLFQRSVELDPTNSLFRQRLGRLLFELGNYPAAEHHLKAALDYGCRADDVHQQLAIVAEAIQNQP